MNLQILVMIKIAAWKRVSLMSIYSKNLQYWYTIQVLSIACNAFHVQNFSSLFP